MAHFTHHDYIYIISISKKVAILMLREKERLCFISRCVDCSSYNSYPANTRRWTNVGLMLAHRLPRRSNNKTTLGQHLVSAGIRDHSQWTQNICMTLYNVGPTLKGCTAVQSQKEVTAHFSSEKLRSFEFVEQNMEFPWIIGYQIVIN